MMKKIKSILKTVIFVFIMLGCAPLFANNQENKTPNNNQVQTLSSSETNAIYQQLETLKSGFLKLDQEIKTLLKTPQTETVAPKVPKLLSPMDQQAANSSIFSPGGAPRPMDENVRPPLKPTTQSKDQNKDKPDDLNKDQSKKDSNDSSNNNSDNSTDDSSSYGNNGGYYPPIPYVGSNQVNISVDNYSPTLYTYSTSSSNISFTFTSSRTLTFNFQNFVVNSASICNSSYGNCQSLSSSGTNTFTVTSSTLNNIQSNLGATQISLSGTNYFVPTFYIAYTATSSSSTTLNGSFSFPTSSSNISCSTENSTASCLIIQESTVGFSQNDS